ncbi:MAG: histidine kinase dimerization/phosphoacceptor domain -containing protein [Saprospiraceae bacterium]
MLPPSKILILFISVLLSLSAFSQISTGANSISEEAYTYFKKSFNALARSNVEKAQIYADSSLLLFESINDNKGPYYYTFLMGAKARATGDYEDAKDKFVDFETQALIRQDTSMLASVNFQLGVVTEALGDLDKSVKYQFESIKYYKLRNDSVGMLPNLNNLGSIHRKLKLYDKAEEYYMTALKLNIAAKSLGGQADNYVNLGNLYGEQDLYDKAFSAYQNGLRLDSITNFKWGLGYDYENLGVLMTKQKKYIKAENYLNKALIIRKELGGKYELGQNHLQLGQLFTQINKYRAAKNHLNIALNFASESGAKESQKDVYKELYRMDKKIGNYKESLQHFETYNSLKDSILNKSTADKISTLNVQYETSKKEQKIALLNADKVLSETKLSTAKRQTYGMLGVLITTSALLFGLFSLYKKTQSQNTIISKSLKEKETLLREIHHRVKNNLQFISSLLGLQTEHISDKAALGALEDGQNRVHSMALIHQNLYQEDNLTGVDMKAYFIKLTRGLFDSYNIRKDQISLILDIEDVNLDVDSVIPIGLIVNELVSNSLKYAFPKDKEGAITVGLKEVNDKLSLIVEDDGIGMSPKVIDNLGESFGYRLIQTFKDQLKADIVIDGKKGTKVELEIRKYDKT